MTTICRTFPTELTARHAIEELRAAGIGEQDIRVLIGRPPGDIRREPVGGFAARSGRTRPSEPTAAVWSGVGRAPAPLPATRTGSAKACSPTPTAS